jgi:two-component system NtrC family sensor kinase
MPKRTFLGEKYEILTALSGEEGLAILKSVPHIQVIISDYRMPEMNGIDFLHEVRREWPDTVRIVLSGYADTASIVSAINEGEIYKFISKPWNEDELKVSIINALERYELNKKNKELTCELKRKNEELKCINDELERLVADKSSKVNLLNEVLAKVQNISYAIPVGVIGIDPDGIIVQCNKEAEKMLFDNKPDFFGKPYEEKLPREVSEFVHSASGKEAISEDFVIKGVEVKVIASLMDKKEQKGTILVFIS